MGDVCRKAGNDRAACTVCGFVCGATADHVWRKGTCTVCGIVCKHQNCTEGVCKDCDYYQPAIQNGVGENGFALYEIYNAGQLLWFADYVNSNEVLFSKTIIDTETNESFYYVYTSGCVNGKVMADIDMSALAWTPIGMPYISYSTSRNSYGYAGCFDGNGHIISGINCNVVSKDSMVYAGFFGAVCGGSIKNLTVQGDIQGITGTDYYPAAYAGGIAGYVCDWYDYSGENIDTRKDLYSDITNCAFIGSVSVNAKDQEYAGGIVGIASGTTITNCLSAATVSTTGVGNYYAGSLCGCIINDCVITNCWYDSTRSNQGEVNGEDHDQVTGISTELMTLGGAAYALGFGQTLGVDVYPSYGDDPVYLVTTGCYTYSNTQPDTVTEKDHVGGACVGEAVCADCRVVYGEMLGHSYVGGKCANCGDTKIVSLPGDFNGWITEEMTWTASGYTYTMDLVAGTYQFKLIKDGTWLGNNGTIVDTTTATSDVGWEFADWGGNCTLVATGGTYYFTFNYDTNMLVITSDHFHGYSGGRCVGCGDTKIVSLSGDFNGWVTEEMTWTASGYTYTIDLVAGTYQFKLIKDGTWLGNNGTIVDTTTATSDVGWEFADWGGNCTLVATGGTYYFTFNYDTNMLVIICVHTHAYVAGEVVAPTCSDAGHTVYTCPCGDSYNGDIVAALGHRWVAADCDTPKSCSVCGATEGAALGHNWNEATCTAPKTCSKCGETEGAALGHRWGAADCDTPKTCSVCGATEGAALGHNWNKATCTDPKTCSVCGAAEGAALGHNWNEATCTDPKTCSKCGETEGAALGHRWVAADCDTPKTCSVCGATEGAAQGHNHVGVVTAPTCTEGGYTTYTCSACGDSYVADEVSALGHSWVAADCDTPKTCSVCGATEGAALGHNWNEATCTAPKTCSICGATEGAALGHAYNAVVTAPTCGADGYTTHTCVTCGDSYTSNIVPATGEHTATISYVNGANVITCSACGKTVSVSGSQFKINGAYLTLSSDISVIYRTTIPAGFENAYIVFEVNGIRYTAYSMGKDTNGRDLFSYPGINPQMMGDNICATVYATVDGMEVSYTHASYSVLQYCNRQFELNPTEKLKTLISDLLVYGAASQMQVGYKTDALVTDLFNYELTPSTFPGVGAITNKQTVTGSKTANDVVSASLNLSNQVVLKFGFQFTDTDLSKYTIKVVIGQKVCTYSAADCYAEGGKYYLNFADYSSTQFDDTVTVCVMEGDTVVSRTLTYSVNTYIAKNAGADTDFARLLQAVYNYGVSAKNYVG